MPASGNTIQYSTGCVANEREKEEKEKHRKRTGKEAVIINVSLFSNGMLIRIAKYSIGARCVNKQMRCSLAPQDQRGTDRQNVQAPGNSEPWETS